MKIYGIKTCSTVRKARKFLKDRGFEVEFIDLKETSISCEHLEKWLKDVDIDILLNKRGTTYRTLNLKDFTLDQEAKKEWLCKESMLFKRPILELKDKILVGFNEENYKKIEI